LFEVFVSGHCGTPIRARVGFGAFCAMLALAGTALAVLLVVALILKFALGTSDKEGKKVGAPKKQGQQKGQQQQKKQKKTEVSKAIVVDQANTEDEFVASDSRPEVQDNEVKEAPKKASSTPQKTKGKEQPKKGARAKDSKKLKEPERNHKTREEEEEEGAEEANIRRKKEEDGPPTTTDNGNGDDWEVATAVSKKQIKRKERIEEEKRFELAERRAVGGDSITLKPTNSIPGMAPPGSEKSAEQPKKKGELALTSEQEKQAKAEGSAIKTQAITIPEKCIGRVIGPKGATLKMIQEKTGISRIDTTGEVFTLIGPPKGVLLAEAAINELVEKGFTSLQFDDFNSAFVMVHPSQFPDLIGKQGVIVQAIKKELGVEISFPETPKPSPGSANKAESSKKYKVTLAGSSNAVQKTKDVINEILTVFHSEITHPGVVHEEIEVEQWQLAYIIGTKGSEMKHIQSNFKVKVYTPNALTGQKSTVIVGEPHQVQRAKTYIEKLLWNAENKPRGRGNEGQADDGWGDEEEVEDWMKGYLYKR